MRSPTRLHVGHDFAFEPGQIRIDCQYDEKERDDFNNRDDQFGVVFDELEDEIEHGYAFASGRDSIMVQKRPSVPLVKRVSSAERINPTGTS